MEFVINHWLALLFMAIYVMFDLGCIIVVMSENRNPIRSLAWVIALIFLPVVGLVFYLFFGRSPKLNQMSRQYRRRIMSGTSPQRVDLNNLPIDTSEKQLVKLAANIASAPLTLHNELEIFSDGAEKFKRLKADIRAARNYIFLQYYIFADDALGHEIASLLMEKARQGVLVNVIYDHVGSFSAPRRFFSKMRKAGVDAHPFFRVTFPHLANRINWRNHRKIVVIDGEIGYIGGMNIADRYVGRSTKRAWRDTHFRLKGEIVNALQVSFALDWSFMNQPISNVPAPGAAMPEDSLGIQLVTSGPTDNWNNLALCFLKAISGARKSIYIETPYFLPTESLLQALATAALAKVDVRILMPRRTDSRMIKFASFSFITQCLKAGIKVYLYEPGMLHSKNMIIDDNLVSSGSTNFDFRSFENNFESNLLIYSEKANAKMREIFFEDLSHSTRLSLTAWRSRSIFQKLIESVMRLFAPVL